MAKRRFPKVYLICTDNKIFGTEQYETVNMYRRKAYAQSVCKGQQQMANDAVNELWHKGPVKKLTMHGFYLVHESYFDDEDK